MPVQVFKMDTDGTEAAGDQNQLNLYGHVARIGRGEAYTVFWWGNLRERDHWGDPGVNRRRISGWIFKK
jgi:hypothetical protein